MKLPIRQLGILVLTLALISPNLISAQQFTPPGTVEISEGFYADKSEVTNLSWKEYLYWLSSNSGEESEAYLQARPDSTVWKGAAATLNTVYFWHPAYESYPVVGITREQAQDYCKWRTERVREMLIIRKENRSKTYIPGDFAYRLPTKAEWELLAKQAISEKYLNRAKRKNQPLYNMRSTEGSNALDLALFTAPGISYAPNEYGIYNLLGNVAELVEEEGIVKGGHWNSQAEEVTWETDFPNETPDSRTGFRCVCEIISP